MNRNEALKLLETHEADFAGLGTRRLALFGSVARNEATEESDVDILVDFDEGPKFDRYCDLYDLLENLFGREVDLITQPSLREPVRTYIEKDAINVPRPGVENTRHKKQASYGRREISAKVSPH